jgi:hypothetical protein
LDEAPKGRQPTVSRRGAVSPLGFDMIQEGKHGIWLDIVQAQFGHRPASPVGQEREEELERVPVRTDCMLTRATNASQVIVEECLNENQKGVSFGCDHRSGPLSSRVLK